MHQDALEKIIKNAGNLPRYTSYPTANHFTAAVTADQVNGWLGTLSVDSPLSLYIHIPYCRQLCWYCGCNTQVTRSDDKLSAYVELLKSEISQTCAQLQGTATVSHLHFGGGSPTILPPALFADLMDFIKQHFTLVPDAEIAIEIDPREINEAKIAAYAKAGVNRASLGVQDFDKGVQTAINRIQPFRTVYDVVALLRRYGIDAINFDLIYGLPNQTVSIIEKNVDLALLMKPSRVSLFGYAHVPWMKKHMQMINNDSLPDSAARLTMFDTASQLLKKAGYVAVGLDHFVLPSDPMATALQDKSLARNFQGYTTDTAETMLGFGVSAISYSPQGYWQNHTDLKDYRHAIKAEQQPVSKGIALSSEDHLRRQIIDQLMCFYEIDLFPYMTPECLPIIHSALEKLAPLIDQGLLCYQGQKLKLRPEARQIVRIVAAAFDGYLKQSDGKHAQVA